jgi:hypothetical protein
MMLTLGLTRKRAQRGAKTPRPAVPELTDGSPLPLLVPGQRVAYRCSAETARRLITRAERAGTLVLAMEASREPGVWLFAGAHRE